MDPHFCVLVSKKIELEAPEKVVSGFKGQKIILPTDAVRYPSQVALEWHRGNVWEG